MRDSGFIGCVLRSHKCYDLNNSILLIFMLEMCFICECEGEKQKLEETRNTKTISGLGYLAFTNFLKDVKAWLCPSICWQNTLTWFTLTWFTYVSAELEKILLFVNWKAEWTLTLQLKC